MFCVDGFNRVSDQLVNLAGNYLEIGVFNGESIKLLAEKYPDKQIIGIDPFIEDGNTVHTSKVKPGDSMLEQRTNTLAGIQGLTNVTFYEMTSRSFSEQLTDQQVQDLNISAVLVDGSHHYDDVMLDLRLAMRLIGNKPGLILLDDMQVPQVVRGYNDFIGEISDQVTSDQMHNLLREIRVNGYASN